MQINLSGRTALVTGSTQGIGAAIAAGLAQAGAKVGVNGRDPKRVEQAIEELRRNVPDGDFVALTADVTTEEGARHAFGQLPDVDILVNNVGIFGSKDVLEIDDAEWQRYFDVNVFSAVRLTRMYMPRMLEQDWGRVLYIASESSVAIPAEMVHYGTTKTAMLALGRGFAKRAAGSRVTVNSVLAGPTHTAGVEEFVYDLVGRELPWQEAQATFMREFRPQSLLQRLIEPAEIANMVVYLSSDLASATTGGAVRVDGGIVDSILP
ncbi:SDR family oxidoreductase [Streptomyces sioyaensis]|uniref:SDR family NAD(P)-dependent oxidoreductase n=1 Tax=Streptomyces sioyaensis TaxID=67364 RepID=UPI001F1E5092|nr:SDR family oxidoreductase [Streptomyces sioyaensis]MCF3172707.1 SDR family oxidoreductase [Streptomyces sioyaensis]